MLFSLLDNTAKYSPAGSLIDVRASRDGELIDIEVVDGGPGVPPSDLERIFDKFYRVQARIAAVRVPGSAWRSAAALSKHLGGSIVARNRCYRSGAVLMIRMPVVPEVTSWRMATLDTVLVVDDEPPIRRLLRTSLAAAGYRVVSAEDAASAMSAADCRKARSVDPRSRSSRPEWGRIDHRGSLPASSSASMI